MNQYEIKVVNLNYNQITVWKNEITVIIQYN